MRGKSIVRQWPSLAVLAVAGLLTSCSSTGSNSGPSAGTAETKTTSGGLLSRLTQRTIAIPAGTAISVTVDQTLASDQSHSGDAFDASVAEPVVLEGKTVIPKGAKVQGRVVEASASGRLEHPGTLGVTLSSVEIGGTSYDLVTETISRSGSSHKTRNLEMIGGGAAAGALIGGIAGHGKGAAIGAAAGAGAGTAGAAITGKKDVSIPAESHLTFHLRQAVSVTIRG